VKIIAVHITVPKVSSTGIIGATVQQSMVIEEQNGTWMQRKLYTKIVARKKFYEAFDGFIGRFDEVSRNIQRRSEPERKTEAHNVVVLIDRNYLRIVMKIVFSWAMTMKSQGNAS